MSCCLISTRTMSNPIQSSSSLFAIPTYDSSLFQRINELPTYLPPSTNEESIRDILSITATITILHIILLLILQRQLGKAPSKSAWKASYQLTNLLVNLSLGSLGIYYELSASHTDPSILNKITGYTDTRYFATIQIGYQLWALPIGIWFVDETTSMMVHHVAVICVASTSAFVTCGFRYFTPFFYGVIEISSVPLSIMNAFKNNPTWMDRYPSWYANVRLLFGVTFLVVRVVLWTPFYWNFITLAMMLLRSSVGSTKIILLALFNGSSFVLTMLQYFWASKIVSAMVKAARKKELKVE